MPNKRNAVGSPSRAMGKKRRTANRTGGQIMPNEEITQKKDGAGRRRIAKKTQGVGHVVAEGPVETTDFSSGLENVVSGNGVVYRWVTLGPPPPHLIEGRPTPANRWGANWSIGLENVVSGNGVVYRWVTLGPPPPHLIEGRPTPANRWGANWSIAHMQPCRCEYRRRLEHWGSKLIANKTRQELLKELESELKEIRKDLELNKTTLSSSIRKRTSAPDKRKSSERMGLTGAAFICIVVGLVVLIDVLTIVKFLKNSITFLNYKKLEREKVKDKEIRVMTKRFIKNKWNDEFPDSTA
ncbi:Hypothetical predicted protein [Mytilus galloprovincialis]|uniref:Uncharacterized protein n=1 Tax=Mytilus galloprovincialis TaxID=29158 RepID=A0A8B6G133_MYTGA|nr:Hypothetical predicted protein [Mytilus galloprovincialis]